MVLQYKCMISCVLSFSHHWFGRFELILLDKERNARLAILLRGAGWGGGSRIRYSIKNCVLIRESISEISP